MKFAVAALLGLVAVKAALVDETYNLFQYTGYSLDCNVMADVVYGSHYSATEDTVADKHFENYGVDVYSYVSAQGVFTFDTWGTYEVTSTFYPFYVTPLDVTMYWTRPESGSLTVGVATNYELTALYLETYVRENVVTFSHSIYDAIVDGTDLAPVAGDWTFNADYEAYYADPYWQADYVTYIVEDVLGGTIPSYYGYQPLWSMEQVLF
jgi:hypothetical protein